METGELIGQNFRSEKIAWCTVQDGGGGSPSGQDWKRQILTKMDLRIVMVGNMLQRCSNN